MNKKMIWAAFGLGLVLGALCGCSSLEAPKAGGSADAAYGAATARATAAGGNPRSDIQSLQQDRQQDGKVIQDAQNALNALGR